MVKIIQNIKNVLTGKKSVSKKSAGEKTGLKILLVGSKEYGNVWARELKRNLGDVGFTSFNLEESDVTIVPVYEHIGELRKGYDAVLIERKLMLADMKQWHLSLATLHRAIIEINRERSLNHFVLIFSLTAHNHEQVLQELLKRREVKRT